jgi:hypothetical protein
VSARSTGVTAGTTDGGSASYRLRVVGPDQSEVISEVIELTWNDPDDALETPTWSDADYGHGDKAGLEVRGSGLDGKQIRFVIEHLSGETWSEYLEATGTMSDGVARVEVDLHHPAVKAGASDEDVAAADLRFHCSVAG